MTLSLPRGASAARWLTAAALLLPFLLPWGSKPGSDMALYQTYATRLLQGERLYADVAMEYPPLAAPLFVAPALLTRRFGTYAGLFIVAMGLCDVWQRLLLLRHLPARRHAAFWALSALCSAALYYTYLKRFDLAAVALCTCALCHLVRRPQGLAAWGCLSAAVACKLYPVVLLPLFGGYARQRGVGLQALARQLGFCAGLGLFVGGVSYALGGAESGRWIAYHQARGLHVGSSYTALFIALRGIGSRFAADYDYGCLQVIAPWTAGVVRLAPAATVAALGLTYARVLPQLRDAAALWRGAFAVVVALLLTSKVFSPQYMIWLLPLGCMAALAGRRADWPLAAGLLLGCLFTTPLFPGEGGLARGEPLKQLCLVGRSILLVLMWWRAGAAMPATAALGRTFRGWPPTLRRPTRLPPGGAPVP